MSNVCHVEIKTETHSSKGKKEGGREAAFLALSLFYGAKVPVYLNN